MFLLWNSVYLKKLKSKMILKIGNRDVHINLLWICLVILVLYIVLPNAFLHSVKVPPLLVVSFDGFRWDYLKRTSTPNFDRVIKSGVHATQGLKNVFTTSTLTNHWSMATGLYAESHGIVENDMFDPLINETYIPLYKNPLARNDPRYYDVPGVEPIWVTNQLQKENGRSGSIMWWGAENAIKHVRPTYHLPFDRNIDEVYKIKKMVDWFVNEYPINLGLFWFQDPDHIAHKCGPDSINVTRAIARADELLGILLEELDKADLLDDMNLIITADHGFATLSRERLIHLDSIIDRSKYRIVHHTPSATIIPYEGFEDKIYKNLSKAAPSHHFNVYKKSEIPERLHYKHSSRVTPIVAIADIYWSFITGVPDEKFTSAGTHGFDNIHSEMRPFFMALGPSFKRNYKIDTFDSIDLYALMCELLHLKPNPNNGTLTKVSQLLSSAHENTVWTFGTYILCLLVIASVGGVFIVAACRQHRFLKRKLNQLKLSSFGSSKSSLIADNGSTVKLLSDDDDDDI